MGGGKVDILELGLDTFSSTGASDDAAIVAKGKWETLNFEEESMNFPGNRSVAGLQAITTGMGREYLVLLLGEKDPSKMGTMLQESSGVMSGLSNVLLLE